MKHDEELFALCKEAYEKTGWEPINDMDGVKVNNRVPLYNSDYLLDKLPAYVTTTDEWDEEVSATFGLWKGGAYTAGYIHDEDGFVRLLSSIEDGEKYYVDAEFTAETSLKALLKLTIALADAGEIK